MQTVTYVGDKEVSDAQVNWGGNSDPRGILHHNVQYEVHHVDMRSFHTKVFLVDFPGMPFNSVHFKEM